MPPLDPSDPIVLGRTEPKPYSPLTANGGRLAGDPNEEKGPNRSFIALAVLAGVLFVTAVALLGRLYSTNAERRAMASKLREAEGSVYQLHQENASLAEKMRALEDQLDNAKRENASLAASLRKIEDRIKDSLEEKTYLEDILIHKTREIERLKGSGGAPTPEASAELDALREQNRLLTEKLEKLYSSTSQKLSEINVAKIALEQTIADAKQQVESDFSAVNLGAIRVDSAARPAASSSQPIVATPAASTGGRVRAINEDHGFVVIDLGKAQQVKPDSALEVTRNGKKIATLSVLEIRDAMSACSIQDLSRGETVKVNDSVSVRK